jgi:hypothetical protein
VDDETRTIVVPLLEAVKSLVEVSIDHEKRAASFENWKFSLNQMMQKSNPNLSLELSQRVESVRISGKDGPSDWTLQRLNDLKTRLSKVLVQLEQ